MRMPARSAPQRAWSEPSVAWPTPSSPICAEPYRSDGLPRSCGPTRHPCWKSATHAGSTLPLVGMITSMGKLYRKAMRQPWSVTQVEPEQVTTDGHTSYPKAIAEELGTDVDHRTSQYKNNVMEIDQTWCLFKSKCFRERLEFLVRPILKVCESF